MIRRTFMVCLVLTFALAGSVLAQGVQTATITGTVSGPDGTPLPGVTITATSPAQIGERQAVSGSNGDYVLRGLAPGNYSVKFALDGMQTFETQVAAGLGATARADASMRLTGATETITVTADAPSALETSSVGVNVTKETVDELPVVRTPVGIASLAAGVTNDRTPVGGQLSMSGAMAYDNSFLVNGVNVMDPIFGTTNGLFIEDSILETQVLTSGISAEYGHFTGGVVNAVTKSGGNDFSGSFRANLTKPEWRDETKFEDGFRGDGVPRATPIKRQGDISEIYEGTLGGPILRDRLWFFGAGRLEESVTPFVAAVAPETANIELSNPRYEVKLTGNLTASHSLQGSYIDNPVSRNLEVQLVNLELEGLGTDSERINTGFAVNYTGVLTNNLFAEARYSEKKFGFRGLGGKLTNIENSPFRASTRFPNNVAGTFNAPYFDATDPEDRNNEQLFGAMSYFLTTSGMGSHDLKAGAERFTVTRTGGNSQTATDYVFYTGYVVNGPVAVLDAQGRLQPVFNPDGSGLPVSNIGWWIATRGSVLDITTDSFFVNDRWDFNSNWTFNMGGRYEMVRSDATGEIVSVDTDTFVPRLGLTFDPLANGKYKFDVTYAEYAGRYNPAISGENTPVGNPALLYGYYVGPQGQGRNFAPGFDPNNYVFYYASVPTANIFMEEGLKSPVNKEFTISAGTSLPRGGWLKATFVDRNLTGVIDDFVTDFSATGCTPVIFEGVDAGCVDNVVFRNTDDPERKYQAVQLQARYDILRNWMVEGNYTRQLKNNGNYEGEGGQAIGATPFGNRPEIQSPRENPTGRLSQYQADRVRLWTAYNFGLGRAGNLSAGVVYRYDSPRTFSFAVGNVPRTAAQAAKNPGYKISPLPSQTLFFGDRGEGEFNATSLFDLSLSYTLPIFRSVAPWFKFDVFNATNQDTLVTHNTAILRNGTDAASVAACGGPCPVDALGLPTTFRKGAAFGRPAGVGSYTTPREYFISAGVRF
jgi:hypothetical protein